MSWLLLDLFEDDIKWNMPFNTAKDNFLLVSKRIIKQNLSAVPSTLRTYKTDIIAAYSTFITESEKVFNSDLTPEQKTSLLETVNRLAVKFEDCLDRLNCKYTLSGQLFDLPNPDLIKIIGIEIEAEPEGDEEYVDEEIINPQVDPTQPTMTDLTPATFLRMASGQIHNSFSGDPLSLTSFIDSIRLLDSLTVSSVPDTTAALKTFLVSFIKTRIEGKAREHINDTHNTIELIIAALQQNIKPDNSKIIEGRMLGLRLSAANQEDFATKVENLSEAFRRSLIIEGITPNKATEMTIDKTVEVCRKNAHNDLVKSVLEASTFESPKDVIAKLLTQTDKVRKEHQVLSFKAQSHANKNPNQNKGSHSNKHDNRRHNGSPNNGASQGNNNRGNNNNNPRFQNGNRQQNNNNSWQNNRPNNQNRNPNRNDNANANQRNVRIISNSGNGQSPQLLNMGDQTNNPGEMHFL